MRADDNTVWNAYHKAYRENPTVIDSLVQKNTQHIGKQGYTRKYYAIYGDDVKNLTLVYDYYTNPEVLRELSRVAGCQLYTVPSHKTVDLAVQIYKNQGDGTNWHHDRSIYNGGRCFTFLTVIHNTSDQKLTVWTDKYDKEVLPWTVGKAVLIEKFKTFHSVTPLQYGERILLTLTYSEKPYAPTLMHPREYLFNKAKNIAYLGADALTLQDYLITTIIFGASFLILYWLIKKLWPTKSITTRRIKNTR